MTKAEEIKMLSGFIAGAPEGYVKDILSNCFPDIERAIRSDFGFIDFAEHMRAQSEQNAALQAGAVKLASIKKELADLESRRSLLQSGLTELRREVAKLGAL